jgi:hypothetical protein
MTKNFEKFTAVKLSYIFFYRKLHFTYPKASIKDAQAACRRSIHPAKRISSASKI